MEPLRPIVDRKVLQFAIAHSFTPGDFTITSKGGCRLNPQLAKTLVARFSEIDSRKLVGSFSTRSEFTGLKKLLSPLH